MKKKLFLIGAVAGVSILIGNTLQMTNNNQFEHTADITQLRVLNASAGEGYCKQTSDRACSIYAGEFIVHGYGIPTYNW